MQAQPVRGAEIAVVDKGIVNPDFHSIVALLDFVLSSKEVSNSFFAGTPNITRSGTESAFGFFGVLIAASNDKLSLINIFDASMQNDRGIDWLFDVGRKQKL